MFRSPTGAATLLAALTLIPHARAQAPTPADAIGLPPVEVTGSAGHLLDAAPSATPMIPAGQTATTVDRDRYADTPAFSAADILQLSPGVTFQNGNGPRDVSISIRGSNERQAYGIRNIQLFEDAFPVTQPDGTGRADLIDPHAYAGADVARGPSSAQFGNYATGGAINFRTRTGRDVAGSRGVGFDFGSDFGSYGYVNNYGVVGAAGPDYQVSLFASDVRGRGFIGHNGYQTSTENLLGSVDVTDRDRITVKVVNNLLDTDLPIRLSLNQFRQNPYQRGCAALGAAGCASVNLYVNGASGATRTVSAAQAGLGRHDQRTITGLRWEHAIDDRTAWSTQAVFDDRSINQPTSAFSYRGPYLSVNTINQLTARRELFGLASVTSAGINFNYESLNSYVYNVTPQGGATLGARTQTVFGDQFNVGARVREDLAFAPHLHGVVGVGGEYTGLDATERNFGYPAGGRTTQVIPVNRDFVNVAPEAALLWTPREDLALHTRVSTGYGTPQVGNLFTTPAGTFGNNTQLRAQKNLGADLGADWTPHLPVGGTLHASLTGFYEFFRDELVTQSAGVNLQSYTFNVPHSEHRGIEIGLNWQPVPALLPGARLTADYLYDNQVYTGYTEVLSSRTASSAFNRSGNAIPGVIPNFLDARVLYDQPDGAAKGLGGFVEVVVRDNFYLDNANLLRAPGYQLVNLEMHYDPGWTVGPMKAVRAFFEVENLFNRTYVGTASNITDTLASAGRENGAAVLANSTGSIFAGAPRTFYGGFRMHF